MPSKWYIYLAGVIAVNRYIQAQDAKGLLTRVSYTATDKAKDGRRLVYETHWNTHSKVVLPEVRRLIAEHGLCLNVHIGILSTGETWETLTVATPKASDYVRVLIHVQA